MSSRYFSISARVASDHCPILERLESDPPTRGFHREEIVLEAQLSLTRRRLACYFSEAVRLPKNFKLERFSSIPSPAPAAP